MSKYKLNKDHKELSDEQIDKHKDFKKLLYNYHDATNPLYRKPPIYKNRKLYLALLIILLIVYLIVEFVEKDGVKKNDEKVIQTEQTK